MLNMVICKVMLSILWYNAQIFELCRGQYIPLTRERQIIVNVTGNELCKRSKMKDLSSTPFITEQSLLIIHKFHVFDFGAFDLRIISDTWIKTFGRPNYKRSSGNVYQKSNMWSNLLSAINTEFEKTESLEVCSSSKEQYIFWKWKN